MTPVNARVPVWNAVVTSPAWTAISRSSCLEMSNPITMKMTGPIMTRRSLPARARATNTARAASPQRAPMKADTSQGPPTEVRTVASVARFS